MISAFNVSAFVSDTSVVVCTLLKVGDNFSNNFIIAVTALGLKTTLFKCSLCFFHEKLFTKAW